MNGMSLNILESLGLGRVLDQFWVGKAGMLPVGWASHCAAPVLNSIESRQQWKYTGSGQTENAQHDGQQVQSIGNTEIQQADAIGPF